MEQKRYHSIVRLGHKTTHDVLNVGDYIVVQEKIDGANASFLVNEDGEIDSFSRNTKLTEGNNLGGFYEFANSLNPKVLFSEYIYFGEWTSPHKVKYPNHQKNFFLFDIYDKINEQYLGVTYVEYIAESLGMNVVPRFYKGKYKSYEHLESFVGQTLLGGELNGRPQGEGIVVKNIDYRDRFGKQLFVKLVAPEFREVQKQKPPKDPNKAMTQEQLFIESVINEARVEKILYKLVEEGVLDEEFGIEDMGSILKSASNIVLEDAIEEEKDSLPEEYDGKTLKKALGKVLPLVLKNLIKKREGLVTVYTSGN